MKLKLIFATAMVVLLCNSVFAAPVNIVNPGYTHFADFINESPAGPISNGQISNNTAASTYGDFGWHDSPSGTFPHFAGIMLGSQYVVTGLAFQVHVNPFKNFILEGSNDTTTGSDGTWAAIYSDTVTTRTEFAWQQWTFGNTTAYSSYRVFMLDDYVGGHAMYRWQLLGEPPATAAPEPTSVLMIGLGLTAVAFAGRKRTR